MISVRQSVFGKQNIRKKNSATGTIPLLKIKTKQKQQINMAISAILSVASPGKFLGVIWNRVGRKSP